jgi:hypothetical protein
MVFAVQIGDAHGNVGFAGALFAGQPRTAKPLPCI